MEDVALFVRMRIISTPFSRGPSSDMRFWSEKRPRARIPDEIPDEIPGDVGLLLWMSLHNVTLWMSTPPGKREALFEPEAASRNLQFLLASEPEPALEVSLTALANVVANPTAASPEIVSLVCLRLSRWAEERGALATALGYAEAGALVTPQDPAPAYSVGALALRRHFDVRARKWLRWTLLVARRAQAWNVYAQTLVDLAALHARHGMRRAARRYYVQAVRLARRRTGLMPVRGAALHGLFLMAMEAGKLDEAERLARQAMRAYGRGHPRLTKLMHDIAHLWVTGDNVTRAIAFLQKLLISCTGPVERALTLSILARVAADAGELKLYQDASMDAWAIINREAGEETRHARALLELARAGVKARDWVHMDRAARAALSAAARTGEKDITAQVESLLAELRRNLRL
jgi:hypothetical protein